MVAHRVGSFSAFQAEVKGTGGSGSGSGCYGVCFMYITSLIELCITSASRSLDSRVNRRINKEN
jgi:hypothetical protein